MEPRRTVRSLRAFAEALSAARERAGLRSAEELAARTGLTGNTVRTWCRGANEPGVLSAAVLADVLGVSLDSLAYTDAPEVAYRAAPHLNLAGVSPDDQDRLAELIVGLADIMRTAPETEAVQEVLAAVQRMARMVARARAPRVAPHARRRVRL